MLVPLDKTSTKSLQATRVGEDCVSASMGTDPVGSELSCCRGNFRAVVHDGSVVGRRQNHGEGPEIYFYVGRWRCCGDFLAVLICWFFC